MTATTAPNFTNHLDITGATLTAVKGAQAWRFKAYGRLALGNAGLDKIAMVINVDHSYPNQGGAHLSIMTHAGWQEVATIFGNELDMGKTRYQHDGDIDDFAPFIDRLVQMTRLLYGQE
jgi:hypothetical protein